MGAGRAARAAGATWQCTPIFVLKLKIVSFAMKFVQKIANLWKFTCFQNDEGPRCTLINSLDRANCEACDAPKVVRGGNGDRKFGSGCRIS